MKIDFKQLQNPSVEYRAKPFWSLKGKLEKSELKKQILYMKDMGFGGVFLHSRYGLVTEYMGEEWLDCINYCVNVLKENGMQAYLYDEDRFPSGTCGGKVTEVLEYRAKYMLYREVSCAKKYNKSTNFIALFSVCFEDDRVKRYRKISDPKDREEGERVFEFYYEYMQGDTFYNGNAYVDVMNRQATEYFIQLTHQKYKEVLGDKFGKEVVGIFTDEPNRGPYLQGFSHYGKQKTKEIPYTYALFNVFFEKKGYKIEDRLPVLWFARASDDFCKESYDLLDVLNSLFIDNYAKPYHEWCKENNLVVTGHVLHEDSLSAQTITCGSVMRYYEYMDYPGMDNLTDHNYVYTVPLLVSSVANQLGKDFVLDEMYGCTGWDTNFADYKRIGDWQSAGGVTLRCPHLSWYTMKGEAKRDYPASILHQSAWFGDYHLLEDYYARLSYLFKNGEDHTDIAIINPVESIWGYVNQKTFHKYWYGTPLNPVCKKIEKEYKDLCEILTTNGVYTDYVDEEIFLKYGKVEDGKFICGRKAYKHIVLNGNVVLRKNTADAIKKFVDQNGKVTVVGDMPKYLDGERYDFDEYLKGVEKIPFEKDAILQRITREDIKVDDEGIIARVVEFDDAIFAFVLNAKERPTNTKIRIKTPYTPYMLDLRGGEVEKVSYERDGEYVVLSLTLKGKQECGVYCSGTLSVREKQTFFYKKTTMPSAFDYALSENNMLVLNRPRYTVCGKYQGEDYILDIDDKLRERFGLQKRNFMMIQPWYREKYFGNRTDKLCEVFLSYEFLCEVKPKGAKLMLEELDRLKIYLNGVEINLKEREQSPIDCCYKTVAIPDDAFVTGVNVLCIQLEFYEERDLEDVFLVGNFGVSRGEVDKIVALPKKIRLGDLNKQGFPYYGGKIFLSAPMKNGNYKTEISGMECALVKVNDESIAFLPHEGEFVVNDGRLRIELVLNRHNSFGTKYEDGKPKNIKKQGILGKMSLYEGVQKDGK